MIMSWFDDFVRLFKPDPLGSTEKDRKISNPWNYYTDIHPTKKQYEDQQFWKSVNPVYSEYLRTKSEKERNDKIMQQYGVAFEDIDYPHLSGLLASDPNSVIVNSAWQFSKNMTRLYK